MKKKFLTIVGILDIITLTVIGLILGYKDSERVKNLEEPEYTIKVISEDGSKITYWGLGYKVIRYTSISPYEPFKSNRGVKYGSWFMKFELDESSNNGIDNVITYDKTETNWVPENVEITVKEDSITKTGAIIVIEDKNENPTSWGLNFAIQKSGDNDKWVDMIMKDTISWIEIAINPNENGITEMQLDWSEMYGELSLGTYRVVKYNGLSTLYSKPFTVK